jgi:hypothetical protein
MLGLWIRSALRDLPAAGRLRLLTAATGGGRGRVVGFVTLPQRGFALLSWIDRP